MLQVLDQGSLYGTREPSAACVGRIGKLQRLDPKIRAQLLGCEVALAVSRMPVVMVFVIGTRVVPTVVRRMPSRREPRRAREKRLDRFDYMPMQVTH